MKWNCKPSEALSYNHTFPSLSRPAFQITFFNIKEVGADYFLFSILIYLLSSGYLMISFFVIRPICVTALSK